jgi:hypothetical protein
VQDILVEIGQDLMRVVARTHYDDLLHTTREQAARIAELEERVRAYDAGSLDDHPAVQQQRIAELEAKLAQAEQERDTWKKAFHSVTPGGSEYANDPQACVDFVRKSRSDQHEVILKFKQGRDEARQERDQLRDWQATVTVSLQRPGGAFYTDVPQHIKALVANHEQAARGNQALKERVGRAEDNFLKIQGIAMKLYDLLCKAHDLIKHDEWLKIIVPTGEITEADIRWAEQALKEAR